MTLENHFVESVPADGGRRHNHPRPQETGDCGLRASRRACAIRGPHGYLGAGSREKIVEEQAFCCHNPRVRNLEAGDRLTRVSLARVGEEGGFSRRDSRKPSEDPGQHRCVSQERIKEQDGHRQSSSWVALRDDSGQRSSDGSLGEVAGSHPRDSRAAVKENAWVDVPETRGPGTIDSVDQGSEDRCGSWEGASVDGSHCLSSSWEGVSEDRGYEARDSSRVSISEDSSRRLRSFWERESEENSCFRGSWERREDRGPRASDEESSSCSSGPCVGASEDQLSSRDLGSTPPQSPSPRTKNHTMPGVANPGPSKSCRETADSSGSQSFAVIPCLGHNTFLI